MNLVIKKYSSLLTVQAFLFIIEFLINVTTILFINYNKGLSLVIFIVQSACIILSLSTLLLTIFSTYAFQAGLADLLFAKFYLNLIVFLLYFILTTTVQVWLLIVLWNTPVKFMWNTELLVVFILQKLLSPVFYYYYKRTSLRISDPRFYEDAWTEKVKNVN